MTKKIVKSDDEWRKTLSAEEFRITRQKGVSYLLQAALTSIAGLYPLAIAVVLASVISAPGSSSASSCFKPWRTSAWSSTMRIFMKKAPSWADATASSRARACRRWALD